MVLDTVRNAGESNKISVDGVSFSREGFWRIYSITGRMDYYLCLSHLCLSHKFSKKIEFSKKLNF